MEKISLKYDCGIPQYSCSSCCNCSSSFGISLCSVKNRGCCWYFPKFTLYEIHKLVKSEEGLEILQRILKLPNVKVYNYYIHAKGHFDEEGYNNFKNSVESLDEKYSKHDETIFFRTCPFVEEGIGCTLPAKYRSYICNFFICDEIINKLKDNNEYLKYEKERDSYVRWINWENTSLQVILEEKHINLIDNFYEVIKILKEVPLEHYEFANLEEVEFE